MGMYVTFWMLCGVTLAASLGLSWVGFRVKSMDLGLKGTASEIGTFLVVSALQALLLFTVYELIHWTHWLQYLVAGLVAIFGYKATHVAEMDDYQHLAIAVVQLGWFWVAVKLISQFGGLARRFPMFA